MHKDFLAAIHAACGRWKGLLDGHATLAAGLKAHDPVPTTVGIKVEGQAALLETIATYFVQGDQAHFGPVDGRTIATIRKPEPILGEVRFIKVLERKPGKDDPTGIEHLDVLLSGNPDMADVLRQCQAAGLDAREQHNESHGWVSIDHRGFEFKLTDHTVWDVCIKEMREAK
ncbi:MAG: hypothetical protein M3N59_02260 [bacterium]|nr:hypothetical protein [bacterium]